MTPSPGTSPLGLFVYGSLRPGERNEHVLSGLDGSWERASVRGRLHEEGWGSSIGYPAIVLDDRAEPVPGWLFVSDDLEGHWDRLDAFEGEEYRRVRTRARLEDGSSVPAWVYVLRGPAGG